VRTAGCSISNRVDVLGSSSMHFSRYYLVTLHVCAPRTRSERAAKLGLSDLYAMPTGMPGARGHDHALLCGSGPSAGLVDSDAAASLHTHTDVWASNQFFVHDALTPRFYHAEFKPHTLSFWRRHFTSARFVNTTFIVDDSHEEVLTYLKSMVPKLVVYRSNYVEWRAKQRCREVDGLYIPRQCSRLRKSCTASTTLILHLMALFEYRTVYIIGVDLAQPGHFWTNQSKYSPAIASYQPQVTTRVAYGPDVHSTHARGVHIFIQSFLAFNRIGAINLSPASARIMPRIPPMTVESLVATLRRAAPTPAGRTQNALREPP